MGGTFGIESRYVSHLGPSHDELASYLQDSFTGAESTMAISLTRSGKANLGPRSVVRKSDCVLIEQWLRFEVSLTEGHCTVPADCDLEG